LAAPGTLYYRLPGDQYGVLRVDALGTNARVTSLPELGAGGVTGYTVEGSDAWLSGPVPFAESWLGAWVVLLDAGGGELGVYEVVDLDATGRVRLAGAAGTLAKGEDGAILHP